MGDKMDVDFILNKLLLEVDLAQILLNSQEAAKLDK